VQPLRELEGSGETSFGTTHNTENADAYIVYNVYGELDGYTAARLVAYLTGKTYRKVLWVQEPQYVNGNTGYLVASPRVCAEVKEVKMEVDGNYGEYWHHTRDAYRYIKGGRS
jgi:hypothetical protein